MHTNVTPGMEGYGETFLQANLLNLSYYHLLLQTLTHSMHNITLEQASSYYYIELHHTLVHINTQSLIIPTQHPNTNTHTHTLHSFPSPAHWELNIKNVANLIRFQY